MAELTIGSKVKTNYYGEHYYGSLLWKGTVEGKTFAGIELEEVVPGGHDGSHGIYGNRFQCPIGRGIYISMSLCKPDDRDMDSYGRVNFEVQGWGQLWICGDCKELGNWDEAKSLFLRRKSKDSYEYVGTAWLPTNKVIQWKMCFLVNDKIKWEDVIENRIIYLKPGEGLTTKTTCNIDTQIEDRWKENQSQVSDVHSTHSQDVVTDPVDPVFEEDTREGNTQLLDVGSPVEVMWQRKLCYGVIRWVGDINSRKLAGIELDEAVNSGSNGTIHINNQRHQFFNCEDYHGIYVPLSNCKPDGRFVPAPVENQEEMYGKVKSDVHESKTDPKMLKRNICEKGENNEKHEVTVAEKDKGDELERYMLHNVVEFSKRISVMLPQATREALLREKDESQMVKILLETLKANKNLSEGYSNVFLALGKEEAAKAILQFLQEDGKEAESREEEKDKEKVEHVSKTEEIQKDQHPHLGEDHKTAANIIKVNESSPITENEQHSMLNLGNKICLKIKGETVYGILRWKGNMHQRLMAGVELDAELSGAHDGKHPTFGYKFHCDHKKGIYTPFNKLLPDQGKEWTKLKTIGSGSFGEVFLCEDKTGKQFACKQIKCSIEEISMKEVQMLKAEIETLKKVKHQHIVEYYGYSQTDTHICIFLQYMKGGSVRSKLVKEGAFPETEVRQYTRQILEGVAFLHESNIIHRDIKGSNILLDGSGNVKLGDFGTAVHVRTICGNTATNKTKQTGIGTPNWMAPEVIQGKKYGRKVDIWSIGCTVVEMLTKQPPWSGLDVFAALFRIVADEKPDYNLPPGLSEHPEQFLSCCFSKDPEKRSSAQELLEHEFCKTKED